MAAALLHSTLLVLALAMALCVGAAASTDTVSAGRSLAGGDARLVSNNGKFVLGFFQAPQANGESINSSFSKLYLGIWFSAVPDLTTVWVANGASPDPELAISADGDLAVFNRANGTTTWSTKSATGGSTAKNTSAVLLNSGNLVLLDASNQSDADQPCVLWQSFDHPTDTLLPSAKLGRDKVTGLNRRLVSNKTPAGPPSPGAYCYEVDPATPQLVLKLCDSSTTYWSSGAWNGQYFANIPELSGNTPSFQLAFVDDDREVYLQYNVTGEAVVTRNFIDAAGQNIHQVWLDASRSWLTLYATPKAQCDVYGVCGPNAVCSYSLRPLCSCMEGFSVRSPEDWAQGDRSGGCVRDTPLDCNSTSARRRGNTSAAAAGSGDKFFSMAGVSLPDKAQRMQAAKSTAECSEACLNDCSCSAYAYGAQGQGCLVWRERDGLLNAKSGQSNGGTAGAASGAETLYLRLAASEIMTKSARSNRRRRVSIGVAIGAGTAVAAAAAVLLMAALMMRRRRRSNNGVQGGGLVAFRYRDLRAATKNFSEKIGQGGFGSVFKGQLRDTGTTDIAVKRLDGSFQGEKQFRAEVSSIGIVRHVNLVKLVGFCCDGDGRFLVYEHMPNRSLDIHLFRGSNGDGGGGVFLDWSIRYQIAVGVARGLAYLHEGCRDRIIHCDVKPQNILLDASLRPKIADFGMAKFVGRDFSRVLTTMRGTTGYLAPEWISGTLITPKVDVYSYGMVLLELVSGRRNWSGRSWTTDTDDDDGGSLSQVDYFPVRASRKLLEGEVRSLLDERLCGEADLKEVERACKVACWCIQDDEEVRPAMGQVVQILEGVLDRDMPPLPRRLEAIFKTPHSVDTSIL